MKPVLVLALAFCGFLAIQVECQLRQVGGHDVSSHEFPFVAVILYARLLSGNGAIIAPRWILTSASAVYPTPDSSYDVIVGSDDYFGTGTWYGVGRIYRHPEFVGWDYNIALVYLRGDIKYTGNVQPIRLATVPQDTIVVSMLSYGKNEYDTSHLQAATYTLTSNEECLNMLADNSAKDVIWHKNGYCLVVPPGKTQGQWYNDAGAPLVANGELYGVFAFSENEGGLNVGSVGMRLTSFAPWIQSTMAKIG